MTSLPLDEYLALELARRTERCLRLEQEIEGLKEALETERELCRTLRAALRSKEEIAAEWEQERRWQRMAGIGWPAPATRMGGE